eukprot:gene50868-62214_t
MRIDKLTTKFQQALADAQSLALGNDHAYIEPVHLLAAMLRQDDGPTPLLQRAGVNVQGLLGAADANARELLGTMGYFAPTITVELTETPDSKAGPRTVVVTVQPGPQTRIVPVVNGIPWWYFQDHHTPPPALAFLRAIADEIEARAEAITEIGSQETGLPEARLQGERGRTTGQLRLFADHIEAGAYLDRRFDAALPERQPAPRPEIRLIQRPIGPVAVFGASNFPL